MVRVRSGTVAQARGAGRAAEDAAAKGAVAAWGWALAGLLLGALVALVLRAPAAWLAHAVNALGAGRVALHHSSGTVWQGSAQLVFAGGAGSRDAVALPSRLAWTVRLHARGVDVALQSACCTPEPLRLSWQPGWQSWQLQVADGRSVWPAALLAGLGTPWNTVQLAGPLAVHTQGVVLQRTLQRWEVQGAVQVEAQDLSSRLSTLRPLGSYRLQWQGGAQPRLDLHTLQGRLQMQGQGRWVGERWRFVGEARAQPEVEAELSNLLNIMGRRDGARSVITLG